MSQKVLLWLSFVPGIVFIGYMIQRHIAAIRARPTFTKQDIVYQEFFASGASQKNFLTKLGGAQNCLRLVVTREWLWVTSWFPFSLIAPIYDLAHVIPLTAITSVTPSRAFFAETLLLTYADSSGQSHSLKLIPKNRDRFLAAITARPPSAGAT